MIEFIKEIAVESGKIALAKFADIEKSGIGFKNERDLVTETDKGIETFLRKEIGRRFPDHDILGEEQGMSSAGGRFCWVIDPIDGTTSYVHGQPFFSVSIALQENGVTKYGVVCAPKLNELYWAQKGEGAFCNGERIHVSSRARLIDSVLSTGFACIRGNLEENNLPYFNRIIMKLRGVRRYGSAAIDLSYVASGKLEGFWELNLKIYDIAAGVVILQEAGGHVCDFHGGYAFPEKGTVATNGKITEELLECFK